MWKKYIEIDTRLLIDKSHFGFEIYFYLALSCIPGNAYQKTICLRLLLSPHPALSRRARVHLALHCYLKIQANSVGAPSLRSMPSWRGTDVPINVTSWNTTTCGLSNINFLFCGRIYSENEDGFWKPNTDYVKRLIILKIENWSLAYSARDVEDAVPYVRTI